MSKDLPEPAKPAETPSKRSWEALKPSLSEWMLGAMSSMAFHQMTPVQASTIPLFLGNKDVVVEAVTGSGKTLSFLVPVIEKLLRQEDQPRRHQIGAIIVSPTRELAQQIYNVLVSVLAFHGPSAAHLAGIDGHSDSADEAPSGDAVVPSSVAPKIVPQLLLGGMTPPSADLSHFITHSPNLLIATPGRLLDLISSPHVHITQSTFSTLILDEADRLLDLGFSDTLRQILGQLPKQRRTGLFSASMSEALDRLVKVGLRNPVKVVVRVRSQAGVESRLPSALSITALTVPTRAKIAALLRVLAQVKAGKALVYLATCHAVDYWSLVLPHLMTTGGGGGGGGPTLIPLHGKMAPEVRRKNFSRFVDSPDDAILLTTDVAARGLDVPSVDLVVQFDPPADPKTFVHRCGRAGRAGRRGQAVTLLTPQEDGYREFLRIRGTPVGDFVLTPSPTGGGGGGGGDVRSGLEEEAADLTARTRRFVLRDRATHDRAQRAFVGWVRAYGKHVAGAVFDVRALDWAGLAEAWGLLRLPKMPEAKGWEGDWRLGHGEEVLAGLRYADKVRERKRTEGEGPGAGSGDGRLPEEKKKKRGVVVPGAAKEGAKQGEEEERRRERAWTRQKEMKKTREERREKRVGRRERERKGRLTEREREEERETERLVEEVRRRNAEAFRRGAGKGGRRKDDNNRAVDDDDDDDDEWEGFDD